MMRRKAKQGFVRKNATIAKVFFELFDGFGSNGNPVYQTNVVIDDDLFSELVLLGNELREVTDRHAATSLGSIVLLYTDGEELAIDLVFLRAEKKYSELVYVKNTQYVAGSRLERIIQRFGFAAGNRQNMF